MKKLLPLLIVPLLASAFLLPQPAKAVEEGTVWAQSTYIAQNYLTHAVAASDTLKWTVKSMFDGKVYARRSFEVYGNALFHNFLDVRKRLTVNTLEVAGDATFGESRFDNFWAEGKIRRSGGDVYIDDGLLVTGDLNLQTASIGSNEITDGSIQDADLAEDYQKDYAQIVTVRAIGTDTQNGTLLRDTVAGISDASAAKPYLVKIEPGVYDMGSNILFMKGYIDIEGSGQDVTIIRSNTDGSGNTGVVHGFSNAEIRNLTVDADGTFTDSIGILIGSGADVSVSNVKVYVHGATINATGIECVNASPTIEDVLVFVNGASASSSAIGYDTTCSGTLSNAKIYATSADTLNLGVSSSGNLSVYDSHIIGESGSVSYGIGIGITNALAIVNSTIEGLSGSSEAHAVNGGSTIMIDRSTLIGDDATIDSDGTIYGGATQFDGTVTGAGTYKCTQSYDGSFALINSSCL